jgi:hypothetical protein
MTETYECIRCRAPATQACFACAAPGQVLFLCDACDAALNELVLRFLDHPAAGELIAAYRRSKHINAHA